ncbi:MAG: protein kinase [Planctomycetaceae bacterium]|nr:protein kinase [Planctomycetaceae bacterium]
MAGNSDSGRGTRVAKSGPPPSTADSVKGAAAKTSEPASRTIETPEKKFLGKYKLEKALGAGGMGTVYLATDMELRRQVALKILPRDKAENPRLVQRFKSEATQAAQLKHENIVGVWDAGEADGQHYIAMEYIDGNDVHQLMAKRGIIPVRRSIEIITQVARALEHAWEKKIVHRDIKPSNLMVRRDGVVKLADLGLARAVDEATETSITRAGTTVGTVDYMAPEQARDSKAADIRSDIYSLGCTWYHMLTGHPPYPDGSLTNKLHAHAVKAPPDPREENDHIPDAVVAVMHRMMAKKPNDRYQDPTELLEDLQRAALGRENVSNSVLAALAEADSAEALPGTAPKSPSAPTVEHELPADAPKKKRKKTAVDDVDEEPASARPSRKANAAGGTSSAPFLPPREKKKKSEDDADDTTPEGDGDRKKAILKYAAVAALLAAAFGIMWYVSRNMASAVTIPVSSNPFDNKDAEGNPNAVVTAEDAQKKAAAARAATAAAATDGDPSADAGADAKASGEGASGGALAKGLRITIGRENERPFMPAWIATLPVRADIPQIEKSKTLPVLTVGRTGDGKPSQFANLSQALNAVPKTGAVVQLHGAGPFFLRPMELAGRTRLILAGAEGSRPVIMLLPDVAGNARTILRVSGMSLELLGVHLTAVARQFPSTEELTLVEVTGGDLSARQTSLTLQGGRPGATVALRVTGEVAETDRIPANSPRVLLDRTFVRGQRLTSLALGSSTIDVVASNTLLATGDAPALQLREPLPAASAAPPAGAKKDDRPARSIRFLSCTLCGGTTPLDLAPTNAEGALPLTSLRLMNSVVAVERAETNAAIVELGGWPTLVSPSEDQPAFRNLQIEAPTTLFVGWSKLLNGKAELTKTAAGSSGWQQAFGSKLQEAQFPTKPWPGRPLENVGGMSPAELDTASLESTTVKPEGGGFCGCKADELSIPSDETLARTEALADRPITVPVIAKTAGAATAAVTIDAGKEDLGKAITNGSWKSGATLKVTSSKTSAAKSSPIALKGRSVRIEIDPSVSIEMRDGDYKGSSAPEAFLTTGGGSVEIVGGRFRVPASTKSDSPRWLFHIDGGSFSIDGCVLQGPMIASKGYEGLIKWTRNGSDPVKSRPAGHYEQYGALRNSFLATTGKALSGDLRGRGLIVQNSALASLDTLFDINLAGPDGRIAGAIDVEGSALSALNTVFPVRAASLSAPAEAPLKFFSHRSAFLSSVDAGSGPPKPTLLSYTGKARAERQIDWWASHNAYGDEFRTWLKGAPEPPGDQEFDKDWSAAWGPGHELRPLLGRGAAVTRGGFKPKAKVAAGDFEMDDASPAGKWDVNGGTIGPAIANLGESDTPKPMPPAAGPGKKPDAKPMNVVKPMF